MFIDLIALIHSICINSVEFSNIFDILIKTNHVFRASVMALYQMKSHHAVII
jgi:hypothetical protein